MRLLLLQLLLLVLLLLVLLLILVLLLVLNRGRRKLRVGDIRRHIPRGVQRR